MTISNGETLANTVNEIVSALCSAWHLQWEGTTVVEAPHFLHSPKPWPAAATTATMEDDLKAELTCPICMDLFREPRRLPCGHVYCRVCLQDMLTRKYLNTRASERILSCPECRQRYDLTFQEAGVDVFPRDFKLVRLVELCQKKFSPGQAEDAGGDGGAQAGADNQTAVKTVDSSERESIPPTASSSAEPASSTASGPSPSLRESLEASLHSSGTPSASLSDDSWIYVASDPRLRLTRPALLPPLGARRHERGDDTWLLPSVEVGDSGQFPSDASQDVRGSAAVEYQTFPGGAADPAVNISGRYENDGRENFQRFAVAADEPAAPASCLPNGRVTSPSSDSSSESDTSDERGDEGSDERSGDDVSRSGSEAGSRGQRQRSRLTRFFRSLVMSDTDSFEEDDDQAYVGAGCRGGGQDGLQRGKGVMALTPARFGERTVDVHAAGSGPEASYFENDAVPQPAYRSGVEARSGMTAPSTELGPEDPRGAKSRHCDSNHNSMAELGTGPRNPGVAACDAGSGAVPSGAVGGGVGPMSSAGRGRAAIEDSEDSDMEYEPQTSMLRPKRKPRSRLKKFFTSLLSLSSSDEDDEEIEGQVASSTSTADRH